MGVCDAVPWAPQCDDLLRRYDAIQAREVKNQPIHRKFEYSLQPEYAKQRTSGRVKLQKLEQAMAELFERSGFRLGHEQARLIKVVTIAFLRKLFADDLIANLKYLEKKFLISDLNDTVAILFPRRSGKTVAMAVMIACITVSQPNGNCIMYNLTAAQAEEFLDEAMKHLEVFRESPTFAWKEVKKDVRKMIRIHVALWGTLNSIKSYACALKTDGTID